MFLCSHVCYPEKVRPRATACALRSIALTAAMLSADRCALNVQFKTQQCNKWWKTGQCAYGSKCDFLHAEKAHTPSSASTGASSSASSSASSPCYAELTDTTIKLPCREAQAPAVWPGFGEVWVERSVRPVAKAESPALRLPPTLASGPVATGPTTHTPLAAPLWLPEPVEPPSTMALQAFWPRPNAPLFLPSKRPNQVRAAFGSTAFSQFGWCEFSTYLTISVTELSTGSCIVQPETRCAAAQVTVGESDFRRYEQEYCCYDPELIAALSGRG